MWKFNHLPQGECLTTVRKVKVFWGAHPRKWRSVVSATGSWETCRSSPTSPSEQEWQGCFQDWQLFKCFFFLCKGRPDAQFCAGAFFQRSCLQCQCQLHNKCFNFRNFWNWPKHMFLTKPGELSHQCWEWQCLQLDSSPQLKKKELLWAFFRQTFSRQT